MVNSNLDVNNALMNKITIPWFLSALIKLVFFFFYDKVRFEK